ncbi:MAG TPA: MFS transporter [Vicinamibacteria bacterium]
MNRRLVLSRDGWLIFAAKAVRALGFGWLSVVLALYLAKRGLSAAEIGAVFTATMVEDALLTMLLAAMATRIGPARVMLLTAPLITIGGVVLATADSPWLLFVGAVLGTLSPNGQDAGPFTAMELSLLPGTIRTGSKTQVFGWYNVFGFLPAALGALLAGLWLGWAERAGIAELSAYRMMLWAYAAGGLVFMALCSRLSVYRSPRDGSTTPGPVGVLGLHRSRGTVLQLAGLQAVDALAGGFIIQSLLAYWFHLRFGVGPEALGALFFGTNLLSALSFLVATRVADRFGLLNTMVFTHLPSNVLLLLVPFMPSFTWAAVVLLARHLLSQMDVPTRQAYTMALVAPEERPAAAGLTGSARALAQACAPFIAGVSMAVTATGLPFFLCGGLKIAYDLALYYRFRSVRLEDRG